MKKLTSKQKGVSLIELMVALAVGLILLMALASVYITANKNNQERSTDDMLDETARDVFERIGQDIELAGYVDMFDKAEFTDPTTGGKVKYSSAAWTANPNQERARCNLGRLTKSGCKGVFTPFEMRFTPETLGGDVSKMTKNNAVHGLEGTDDTLTIRYQAIAASANNTALWTSGGVSSAAENSGIAQDCTGAGFKSGSKELVISNKYLQEDNMLKCSGSNSIGNWEIADGVHQIHFRYLVTAPNSNAKATLYNSQSGLYTSNILSAADVNASDIGWAGVTGVEVCVIAAGEPFNSTKRREIPSLQPSIPSCTPDGAGYAADTARSAGDTKLYRRYVKIFDIPNALYFKPY